MLIHIWIEDEINWDNIRTYYKDINVIWRGNTIVKAKAKYQDYDVDIYFYNKDESNRHLQLHLWCGMRVQKVVINENINIDSIMYLCTRLRCENKPAIESYAFHSEKLIMEITKPLTYLDWLREDRIRDWKDFDCISSGDELKDLLYSIM